MTSNASALTPVNLLASTNKIYINSFLLSKVCPLIDNRLIYKNYHIEFKTLIRPELNIKLNKPNKNWKFSSGDLKERALWENYQECYEKAISQTSTENAPWYIIPSDNKKESRLILTEILLEELSKLKDVKEPELDKETQINLDLYKEQLNKEL